MLSAYHLRSQLRLAAIFLFTGLREPPQQVIADADGIGHYGERRLHRPDADKEARVHDAEIIAFMSLAVRIQHRAFRVCAEPARPA